MRNLICGIGENDIPGSWNHPIYHVWAGMIWQCYGPNAKQLGGRHVCFSWMAFSQFMKWALPRWLRIRCQQEGIKPPYGVYRDHCRQCYEIYHMEESQYADATFQ